VPEKTRRSRWLGFAVLGLPSIVVLAGSVALLLGLFTKSCVMDVERRGTVPGAAEPIQDSSPSADIERP
jgi:hypothetical protein